MYKNLIFNNKKSYKDFGLFITNITLIPPKPRTFKETIPYRDGSFDFSFMYGKRMFDDRIIEVSLTYEAFDEKVVYEIYSNVIAWLYTGEEGIIKIDDIKGFYKGMLFEVSSFERFMNLGELTITFSCSPFKFKDTFFGEDIWDDFNFETDIIEQNEFEIRTSKDINIIIKGIELIPSVTCTSSMTIKLNNKTYSFNQGENKNSNFIFKNGDNKMLVTGNGKIKFTFREVSF